MSLAALIDLVRLFAGAAIGLSGALFVLLSVVGLLRFPDLFTRTHAFSASIGLGAALMVLSLAVLAWDVQISVRLVLLAALFSFVGPAVAHFTAGAAHAAGLAPLAGRYVAPRPGPKGQGQ